MLEFALVKTGPQSSEASQKSGQKPVADRENDARKDDFQSEYETKSKEPADTADEKKTDTVKTDQEQSKDVEAKPDTAKQEPSEEALPLEAKAPANETPDVVLKDPRRGEVAGLSKAPAVETTLDRPVGEKVTVPTAVNSETESEAPAPGKQATEAKATAAVADPAALTATKRNTTAETIVLSKAAANAATELTPVAAAVSASPETAAKPGADAIVQSAAPATSALAGAVKPAHAKVVEPETPVNPKASSKRDLEVAPEQIKRAAPVQTVTPAAPPPLLTLQNAIQSSASSDKGELKPVGMEAFETFSAFETRSTSQASGQSLGQVLNRPETPALIGRQMAEALQRLPDRPVELSLNPRELGRVRMSISAAEAGITVSVVAERPETLDLMRRNIDQLAREFQEIGYENINFSFADGEAQQNFDEDHDQQHDSGTSRLDLTPQDSDPAAALEVLPTTGVDIRL